MVLSGACVTLRDRLNSIDVNVDDVQSGVEAGSRETEHICETVHTFGLGKARVERNDLVATLARHSNELRQCVRDQRGALSELRQALTGLREELSGSTLPVRPPQPHAADRRRR